MFQVTADGRRVRALAEHRLQQPLRADLARVEAVRAAEASQQVAALTQRERFAEHNRETFDAAIATARGIAEELFAPHNRKNDEHEPQYVDGAAVLIPEVEPALRAFHEAGFLNATRDFEHGGMQLPNLLSQACFAHFQSANIATSSYSMLTMGVANLIEAFGNDEQKARYLQPIIDGRFFGTMCLTEPHAGSSLSDIRTKAEAAFKA